MAFPAIAGLAASAALKQGADSKAIPATSSAAAQVADADYFDSRRNGDTAGSGNFSVTLPAMSTSFNGGAPGQSQILYMVAAGAVFALILIVARKS